MIISRQSLGQVKTDEEIKETKPNDKVTTQEQETALDKNSNNNRNNKNNISNKSNSNDNNKMQRQIQNTHYNQHGAPCDIT